MHWYLILHTFPRILVFVSAAIDFSTESEYVQYLQLSIPEAY